MSTASQHFPSSTVQPFAVTNYLYFWVFFRYVLIEICVVLFKDSFIQLNLIPGFCFAYDLIETMCIFLHLRQT